MCRVLNPLQKPLNTSFVALIMGNDVFKKKLAPTDFPCENMIAQSFYQEC